jgi:hypothetical protein
MEEKIAMNDVTKRNDADLFDMTRLQDELVQRLPVGKLIKLKSMIEIELCARMERMASRRGALELRAADRTDNR